MDVPIKFESVEREENQSKGKKSASRLGLGRGESPGGSPGGSPGNWRGIPRKARGIPRLYKNLQRYFQIFTDFWPNFRRFSFKFMPKFQIFSNFWPNLRKNSNLFHFLGSFLLITMVQN